MVTVHYLIQNLGLAFSYKAWTKIISMVSLSLLWQTSHALQYLKFKAKVWFRWDRIDQTFNFIASCVEHNWWCLATSTWKSPFGQPAMHFSPFCPSVFPRESHRASRRLHVKGYRMYTKQFDRQSVERVENCATTCCPRNPLKLGSVQAENVKWIRNESVQLAAETGEYENRWRH